MKTFINQSISTQSKITQQQVIQQAFERITDFKDNKQISQALETVSTVKNRKQLLGMILQGRESQIENEERLKIHKQLPHLEKLLEAANMRRSETPDLFFEKLGMRHAGSTKKINFFSLVQLSKTALKDLEGKEDLDPNEILDYNRVKDRPKEKSKPPGKKALINHRFSQFFETNSPLKLTNEQFMLESQQKLDQSTDIKSQIILPKLIVNQNLNYLTKETFIDNPSNQTSQKQKVMSIDSVFKNRKFKLVTPDFRKNAVSKVALYKKQNKPSQNSYHLTTRIQKRNIHQSVLEQYFWDLKAQSYRNTNISTSNLKE